MQVSVLNSIILFLRTTVAKMRLAIVLAFLVLLGTISYSTGNLRLLCDILGNPENMLHITTLIAIVDL